MRFRFDVVVSLKEGLLDPQGKAVEEALPHLGYTNVSDVRVGKHIELSIEAADGETAARQAEEIAQKLLSNPVIESVRMTWHAQEGNRVEAGMSYAAGSSEVEQ